MKLLRELHDFIAGGSIVAPIGLAIALVVGWVVRGSGSWFPALVFLVLVILTFVSSTFERPA